MENILSRWRSIWAQVECEGLAPVVRNEDCIVVDVGQGVLTYNLHDSSICLDVGDGAHLLIKDSKVRTTIRI
eukprot:9395377-Pyramimonas_sp.AAC.1